MRRRIYITDPRRTLSTTLCTASISISPCFFLPFVNCARYLSPFRPFFHPNLRLARKAYDIWFDFTFKLPLLRAMSLSLKAELEAWAAALEAYDEQDFEKALDLFSVSIISHSCRTYHISFTCMTHQRIADSSKILTNMGLIYATIGEHETAVEHFVAATNLDSYLAIA